MRGNCFLLTLLVVAALAVPILTPAPARADLLVYEPFDYGDAWLNGQGGALGTTGTWVSNDTGVADGWRVHPQGQLTGMAVNGGYDQRTPMPPAS